MIPHPGFGEGAPPIARSYGISLDRLFRFSQFLLPFSGLDWFAPGFIEIHQPLDRLFEFGRPSASLTLIHPFVTGKQQRFGCFILPLAENAAQEAPSIERFPIVRRRFFTDRQALARQRFGLGLLLLAKHDEGQIGLCFCQFGMGLIIHRAAHQQLLTQEGFRLRQPSSGHE